MELRSGVTGLRTSSAERLEDEVWGQVRNMWANNCSF
jgi:hypothetical protein